MLCVCAVSMKKRAPAPQFSSADLAYQRHAVNQNTCFTALQIGCFLPRGRDLRPMRQLLSHTPVIGHNNPSPCGLCLCVLSGNEEEE